MALAGTAPLLAASDELQVATRDATTWLKAHPSPDARLGALVAWMLSTGAQMARIAQVATDPLADADAGLERLEMLLAIVDLDSLEA